MTRKDVEDHLMSLFETGRAVVLAVLVTIVASGAAAFGWRLGTDMAVLTYGPSQTYVKQNTTIRFESEP